MNRGYVTPGAAGLIVFIVGMAVFIIAALVDYSKRADAQYIDRESDIIDMESDMCVIRVTAPCGDDICRYTASVPCSELDALVKASKGGK